MFKLDKINAQAPAPITTKITDAMISFNAGLTGWFLADLTISWIRPTMNSTTTATQ